MTQKVRKGEELDEESLKMYLADKGLIKSANSELNVTQFPTGYSNLTYSLHIEDKSYVLRRPPKGAIKRGHDMGREFKVLSKLNKQFNKAPKVFTYAEDDSIIGSSFFIMEKIEGIVLSTKEAYKRKIPPKGYQDIAGQWLSTFIELHALDYHDVGLGDLGKPEGYVGRQVSNWGVQYLRVATDEIKEAGKVMKWMQDSQPKDYNSCMIHNDFKYDNVVFKDETWKCLKAVLDWEMCTIGDPLMDLGTSLGYWLMDNDHEMIVESLPSPTSLSGNPSRLELVSMYERMSGNMVSNLVFYYVYGLFKIAVIVQQIYYRYNKGLTSDKRFAKLDNTAKILCLTAWQAIQKNSIEELF